MERLCKDCKHYDPPDFYFYDAQVPLCHALDKKQHPITGGTVAGINVDLVRITLCGWDDPKWWEPKPKEAKGSG